MESLVVACAALSAVLAFGWIVRELRRVRHLLQRVNAVFPEGPRHARVFEQLIDRGKDLALSEEVLEALASAEKGGSGRQRVAAHNLLTLEVQEQLQRGQGVSRLAWRIVAAAGVAGALAVAQTSPALGGMLAAGGGALAVATYAIGRMADHETQAARERWNALIRGLGGSFTNG